VRVLAWLQTAPVPPTEEHKTLSKRKDSEPQRVSRLQQILDDGGEPDLPEVSGGLYLVSHLMEAGPASAAGMGPVPLMWVDLIAWQQVAGITLAPWEAKMLRRLSGDYLEQARKAEKPDCPSPAFVPLTEEKRDAVSNRIEFALDTLIDTRPKR